MVWSLTTWSCGIQRVFLWIRHAAWAHSRKMTLFSCRTKSRLKHHLLYLRSNLKIFAKPYQVTFLVIMKRVTQLATRWKNRAVLSNLPRECCIHGTHSISRKNKKNIPQLHSDHVTFAWVCWVVLLPWVGIGGGLLTPRPNHLSTAHLVLSPITTHQNSCRKRCAM